MATLKSLKKSWTYHAKLTELLIREVDEFLTQSERQRIASERFRICLRDKLEIIQNLATQISALLDEDDVAQDELCEESNTLADAIGNSMREL